jgi:hypothetical protein
VVELEHAASSSNFLHGSMVEMAEVDGSVACGAARAE